MGFVGNEDCPVYNPLPSGKWNQWKQQAESIPSMFDKTRFPLGSGINGNLFESRQGRALGWHTRFPLGSGINGNELSIVDPDRL